MIRTILKVLLPLVMLAAGAGTFALLQKTKPQVARAAAQVKAPAVEVMEVKGESRAVKVSGQGTVVAYREVSLQPEISGRVLEVHPQLIMGGRVQAGAVLARLDGGDFQASLKQQQANVERARSEIELERGRQILAQREWEQLAQGLQSTPEGKALALREPQMRSAQAGLEGAEGGLTLIRRNMARTTLVAPFDAMVTAEGVDVGQVVSPQSRVATLVDTSRFQVVVNLSMDDLGWFAIPGVTSQGEGAKAKVIQRTGGQDLVLEGRVERLLGDLDPAGKMARVVVVVDDPLRLKQGGGLPLLLGALVQVEIEGKALTDVVAVPRKAMREGGVVWLMGPDDALKIERPEVVWEEQEVVLVKNLQPGTKLVTSRLSIPVDGMKLRLSASKGGEGAPKGGAPVDAPSKGGEGKP